MAVTNKDVWITEAVYDGPSGFDKEAFKRFRRSHPTLTNQKAMSMFKV